MESGEEVSESRGRDGSERETREGIWRFVEVVSMFFFVFERFSFSFVSRSLNLIFFILKKKKMNFFWN